MSRLLGFQSAIKKIWLITVKGKVPVLLPCLIARTKVFCDDLNAIFLVGLEPLLFSILIKVLKFALNLTVPYSVCRCIAGYFVILVQLLYSSM